MAKDGEDFEIVSEIPHTHDIIDILTYILQRLQRLSSDSEYKDKYRREADFETFVNVYFYADPLHTGPKNEVMERLNDVLLEVEKIESRKHQLGYINDLETQLQIANGEKEAEIQRIRQQWANETNELRRKLEKANKEKEVALTRLSKIAGTRLHENNPTITDLSDENRPQKIAEKFNEIYDNEWTDALDTLTKLFDLEEIEAINKLRSLLMETYETCQMEATKQLENIQRVIKLTRHDCPNQSDDFNRADISVESALLQSAVVDIHKKMSTFSIKYLKQNLRDNPTFSKTFEIEIHHCEKFFNGIIEMCYLMNVQSPQVLLDFGGQENEVIDTSKFKFYTKSGQRKHFAVWPALHLGTNCGLLQKGVIQPY